MESRPQSRRRRGVTTRGRITLIPTRRNDPRASLIAVVLQLVFILILGSAIAVPIAYDVFRPTDVREERLRFVAIDSAVAPRATRARIDQRDGGDNRPLAPTRTAEPAAPIVAPGEVPAGIVEPSGAPRAPIGGTGPLVGGGGPTQGIRPSFNDPRLWLAPARPGDYIEGPYRLMSRADSLKAIVDAFGAAYVDSLRRLPPGSTVPSWVFERNGKKYGLDGGMIRLGDFSIPTALLALLPLNIPPGNMDTERARRLTSMRSEIIEQAERRQRDDDFYRAVKALRERKERERREAEDARRAGTLPP
ncbi:MAG: hypothetical protein RL625_1319 [Gemmatimonadota bacterium]